MEEEIKEAIKQLAKDCRGPVTTQEALHFSQGVLNLAHALDILRQPVMPDTAGLKVMVENAVQAGSAQLLENLQRQGKLT